MHPTIYFWLWNITHCLYQPMCQLLRLQSSEGKFTMSREIEPVRRSFCRHGGCTFAGVALFRQIEHNSQYIYYPCYGSYHFNLPCESCKVIHRGTNRSGDVRSISEISSCFCWAETLAHWSPTSCQKTSTINLFGFETLKLKIRRLKLLKPTVGNIADLRQGAKLLVELLRILRRRERSSISLCLSTMCIYV